MTKPGHINKVKKHSTRNDFILPVTMPPRVVLTPLAALTRLLLMLDVTGREPKTEPEVWTNPRAKISKLLATSRPDAINSKLSQKYCLQFLFTSVIFDHRHVLHH